MEVKIVLGHCFGDEGKGVTVQWLCKKAIEEGKRPLVVRFSGGPQAAHTIFNGGTEHICSSFGSGVLLGVPTMYTNDVYIDPICLMNEYKVLKNKGVEPKLFFGGNRIIAPYDVIAGRNNHKVRTDGTCGKGIFATFDRHQSGQWYRSFFTIQDPEHILHCVSNYYRIERIPDYDDMFKRACLEMQTELYTNRPSIKDCDVLILEGTQGLLLDMDNGFYPNVTPSKVGLNGIQENILQDAELYLVTRTYTTRHGNGYIPRSPIRYSMEDKYESNVTNEFQGDFKTGILEIDLLNRAYDRHHIDNYVKRFNISTNLVVTHMDVCQSKEGYYFDFLDKQSVEHHCGPMNRKWAVEEIGKRITENLIYVPGHVYYNDSVESNIKQLR